MRNIIYYKCSDQYRTMFIWPKNKLSTLGTAKRKKAMGRTGEYNYTIIVLLAQVFYRLPSYE